VFGIHGIGGIIGAIGTGVVNAAAVGGIDYGDATVAAQVLIQMKAVGLTVLWSGIGSLVLYKLVDLTLGLRVAQEVEREGLDLATHGERAYSM